MSADAQAVHDLDRVDAPVSEPVPKAESPTPIIDGVVERLRAVVDEAIAQRDRAGFFAALYLRVTRAVRQGVRDGAFEDGPRMDRLDGLFAGRYLDALEAYRGGRALSESWRVAFDAGQSARPLILQHLLLGMNAHINLDLGIAAVEAVQGAPIATLRGDFMRINAILAQLVDPVESAIGRSAPVVFVLDLFAHRADEKLASFSIDVARDGAWAFAQALAAEPAEPSERRAPAIAARDERVTAIGRSIASPGPLLSLVTWPLRALELGSPAEVTRSLCEASP